MKAVTTKMLVSLIGILLVAPFFAVALMVGARAVALSHGTGDDLLLVAFALGGAAAGILNGMGRHAARGKSADDDNRAAAKAKRTRAASMINLGY